MWLFSVCTLCSGCLAAANGSRGIGAVGAAFLHYARRPRQALCSASFSRCHRYVHACRRAPAWIRPLAVFERCALRFAAKAKKNNICIYVYKQAAPAQQVAEQHAGIAARIIAAADSTAAYERRAARLAEIDELHGTACQSFRRRNGVAFYLRRQRPLPPSRRVSAGAYARALRALVVLSLFRTRRLGCAQPPALG